MTRIAAVVFTAVLGVLAISGCNKPSEEACRKAITNMRSLMGTDSPTSNVDIGGDVRRCKGGSKKKAVECAGNAKTIEELRACDFMKIPHTAGSDTGSGSATTPPPPPPPDPGSAAGSAPGSAGSAEPAGSAGSGSADAAGSGSAGGSAAP